MDTPQYDGTTNYTYDAKNQLTAEQSTIGVGYDNVQAYDNAENPTTLRGAGHSFNADNQATDSGSLYDGNGNPMTNQGNALAFDPENRLTQDGTAQTNTYTGDGLRAWKQTSAGRTYFLYDGDDPIIEMDNTGNITAVNTFGANGLISRHISSGSTFYAFDLSGNVAHRLNSSGLLSTDHYDAFGTRQSTANPQPDPWGFGAQYGYYTDVETGLILCTHRFYDPSVGRWLTPDPAGYAGGINQYAYVGNDPVNDSDPDGLYPSHLGGGLPTGPEPNPVGPPTWIEPGDGGYFKVWLNKDGTETRIWVPNDSGPVKKGGHGDGGRNQGVNEPGQGEHNRRPKGNRNPPSTGGGKRGPGRRFSPPRNIGRGSGPSWGNDGDISCHQNDGYGGPPKNYH